MSHSSSECAKLIDFNEIETKWAAESEERIDAVDRGELQTIDGPTALRDLRRLLRNNALPIYLHRV